MYLNNLLPPTNESLSSYNLRNKTDFAIPKARTAALQKTFFYHSSYLWNNLHSNVKSSVSLSSFRTKITETPSHVPHYYLTGSRIANILHTRLRHSCSSLNADLFCVNIIDFKSCDCGSEIENVHHYFLECPKFNRCRFQLMHELSNRGVTTFDLNTLLFGNDCYSYDVNQSISQAVQNYILSSKRFE